MILSISLFPGFNGLRLEPWCMSTERFPVNGPYVIYGWRAKMNCHCIPGALRADPGKHKPKNHRSKEREPPVTSETRIHAAFIIISSLRATIVMRSKSVNVKMYIITCQKK